MTFVRWHGPNLRSATGPANRPRGGSSVSSFGGEPSSTWGTRKAQVSIATAEVLSGILPRRAHALVRERAGLHREELDADWELAHQGQPLARAVHARRARGSSQGQLSQGVLPRAGAGSPPYLASRPSLRSAARVIPPAQRRRALGGVDPAGPRGGRRRLCPTLARRSASVGNFDRLAPPGRWPRSGFQVPSLPGREMHRRVCLAPAAQAASHSRACCAVSGSLEAGILRRVREEP